MGCHFYGCSPVKLQKHVNTNKTRTNRTNLVFRFHSLAGRNQSSVIFLGNVVVQRPAFFNLDFIIHQSDGFQRKSYFLMSFSILSVNR